jgi:hypothetical protein
MKNKKTLVKKVYSNYYLYYFLLPLLANKIDSP